MSLKEWTFMDLLLVEDHADTAIAFSAMLRLRGYHVEVAHNCKEAAKLFRHNYFDLVLCDLGLPDGDGCDLLRDLMKVRNVRAIAVSAFAMRADKERCKNAGFFAHLTKPVETQVICKVLDDVARGAYEFPLFDQEDFNFGKPTN
jgi:CheY-like chemotaxis protein